MPATALIAIDWGTTSARAYRLDARGDRTGAAERSARHQARSRRPLRAGAREAARRLDRRPCAADRVRHDRQPAGLGRSAVRRLPGVADRTGATASSARRMTLLTIVPGVATRDAAGIPGRDARRGNATARCRSATSERGVLAVLPGTHSKWARVEHGRIVDFTTFMTGELYARAASTTACWAGSPATSRAGSRATRSRAASRAASPTASSRTTSSARARWR